MAVNLQDHNLTNSVTHNLIDLPQLNPEKILSCLSVRFNAGIVYTLVGKDILVSINPCRQRPELYAAEIMLAAYNSQVAGSTPHIYDLVERCMRRMFPPEPALGLPHQGQSVVITGESGAGKTETAKLIMRYLTYRSSLCHPSANQGERIEKRILESNPILEAFGNAQTCRNANSSRFGKYIQLCYDKCGVLQGAQVKTYLLEKTRVLFVKDRIEESFHVFGMFLSSLTPECMSRVGLPGHLLPLDNEVHAEGWSRLCEALNQLGFSTEQVDDLSRVLTALVLLCRTVLEREGGGGEVEDIASLSDVNREKVVAAGRLLGLEDDCLVHRLLKREFCASGPAAAKHSHRRRTAYTKLCSVVEATARRDCLVKSLYSCLFDYLVFCINESIRPAEHSGEIGLLDIYGFESLEKNSFEQLCINYTNERLQAHFMKVFVQGIEEEYARESVNLSNVMSVENPGCVGDNRLVVDLLEGVPGLFSLLDEEAVLNRRRELLTDRENTSKLDSCDAALLSRLTNSLGTKKSFTLFEAGPYDKLRSHSGTLSESAHFCIHHYAGPVGYSCVDLVSKNLDVVPSDLAALLSQLVTSPNSVLQAAVQVPGAAFWENTSTASEEGVSPVVVGGRFPRTPLRTINDSLSSDLSPLKTTPESPTGFRTPTTTTRRLKRHNTVASRFRASLDSLMQILNSHEVSYVRCLRPTSAQDLSLATCNEVVKLDTDYLHRQLLANGLTDAVNIAKHIHAAKYTYPEFLYRYGSLSGLYRASSSCKSSLYAMQHVVSLLDDRYRTQSGLPNTPTKATPKALRRRTGGSCIEHSRRICASVLHLCVHLGKSTAVSTCDGACGFIEQFGRSKLFVTEEQLHTLETLRRLACCVAVRRVQRAWKKCLTRKSQAARVIQSYVRMFLVRRRFVQERSAAITIQRYFRASYYATQDVNLSNSLHHVTFSDDVIVINDVVEESENSNSSMSDSSKRNIEKRPLPVDPGEVYHADDCQPKRPCFRNNGIVSIRRLPTGPVRLSVNAARAMDCLVPFVHNRSREQTESKGLSDCLD